MNLALPSGLAAIGTGIKTAFSGVLTKALLGLAIAGCVVAFVFYQNYQSSQEKLSDTKTTLSIISSELDTLKGTYNNLKSQFDLLKASTEITDTVRDTTEKEKIVYRDNLSAIDRIVEDKVSAIKNKYAAMEDTEANQQAKDREVSSERIKGLWATFCLANADHANCKP